MGRPTIFTEEREDRFMRAVGVGVPPEVAAGHAGFSPATLYRWLRTRPAFREKYSQAVNNLHTRLVGTLAQAALSDPRWALILLERRFPEYWRPSSSVPGPLEDGRAGGQEQADAPIVLDPALIDQLIPKLLEAGRRVRGDDGHDRSSGGGGQPGPEPSNGGES